MSNVEMITLPFKKGSIEGEIEVEKYSRIKVYRFMYRSVKGYLIGFSDKGLTVYEPYDFIRFGQGYQMKELRGHEVTILGSDFTGYAFYPEVTILETKKPIDKKDSSERKGRREI